MRIRDFRDNSAILIDIYHTIPYHELHGLSSLQWWLYILCWWSREERFTAAEKSDDDAAVGSHCVHSGRDVDVDVDVVTCISSNTSRSQYDNTHTPTHRGGGSVSTVCQTRASMSRLAVWRRAWQRLLYVKFFRAH